MEKERKNSRKVWAAALAGVLSVAIILTGTLAWLNMSQETINEFKVDKNPGGRIHDDFNGLENKDIYAENFTDNETGAPVFVRIKLLEYMETGEDAGINRTVIPEGGGDPVTNPDRKAKPLVEGADINDTSTWYLHKPLPEGEKDPFHDYWKWDQDGQTVYMPTFNKNKDSISVDVNGTYVGKDKDFETGKPYDDYVTYTDGQESEEKDAYYDADGDNDIDEWQTDPDKDTKAPGSGGVKKDPEADPPVLEGNYEVKKEKHTAQKTLNGLGIITMKEWLDAEMPICNKWVWDEDGWFYWPEPVLPQTATGLLLDKVTQIKAPSEKCYYAIDLVGQFVDVTDESSLGDPVEYEKNEDGSIKNDAEGNPIVAKEPTGFYVDGITDNAKALLANARKVEIGENGKWYFPQGQNLYKEITNDEGELSDLICAFEDTAIGTDDDLDHTHIVYHEGGVTVGANSYGEYFLKPTATENYYRGVGEDGLLGTTDDSRLWLPAGGAFPDDLLDKVVDTVTVNIPTGTTEIIEGDNKYIEVEVGTTLANAFTADVKLGENPAMDTAVTWSVKAADGKKLALGTSISETTGVLTVDENETNAYLTVTARSKLDNRKVGTYTVKVLGKLNVAVEATGNVTTIKAGDKLIFTATVKRGDEAMAPQPTVEWSKGTVTPPTTMRTVPDTSAITVDSTTGELYVGRAVPAGTTVEVVATYKKDAGDPGKTGSKTVTVTDADAVTVTLSRGAASVEPGDTTGVTFTATLSDLDNLARADVDWTVGTSADSGEHITEISGLTITNSLNSATNVNSGTLVLPADYSITDNGTTLWVKATAKDSSANAWKATSISVVAPTKITIARADGKELKIKSDGTAVPLTAKVMKSATEEYKGNGVEWWVGDASGNAITGISITTDGKVTVATTVTATEFVVKATSKVKGTVFGDATVTVWDGSIIIDGTEVTYDGQTYIVLTKDTANNRQLILRKDCLDTKMKFSDSNSQIAWRDSKIRDYLNNTWIGTQSELSTALADPAGTTIKTRTAAKANTFDTTTDKVFLLSEADVYGTHGNNAANVKDDDYTVGGRFKWKSDDSISKWIAKIGSKDVFYWLRSPYSSSEVAGVNYGTFGNHYYYPDGGLYGIRPACWVKITTP